MWAQVLGVMLRAEKEPWTLVEEDLEETEGAGMVVAEVVAETSVVVDTGFEVVDQNQIFDRGR